MAALIMEELKTNVETEKESADNLKDFNLRQKQILSIMEYGREYTTENIATLIGLKNPRTRQLMNELVELEIIESLGTTKNRRYRKR